MKPKPIDTPKESGWEAEFDEKFVREDGLMDKYAWIGEEQVFMSDAIKSFLHSEIEAAYHKGEEAERDRMVMDLIEATKEIPKYGSQGWTKYIDDFIRKNGVDPVKTRIASLTTPKNTKEEA